MNRLAIASGILILSLFAQPMAQAQGSSIQRGVTSSDLASSVTDIRQKNAQMGLDITRLESEIADLNGKVETLEFLLSQSRDEMNRMQQDDARIGDELERLNSQNTSLKSRINTLEADLRTVISMVQTGDVPPQQTGDAGELDEQRVDTASVGSEPRRIVTREGDGYAPAGDNPDYQGSLGTLQASDLPGEAGPLFATAKSRLLKFDYEGAENAFRAFLARFSDDPQAGEAQYWLAETLFQQEAYAESGQAYTQMIREHPEDARAPDALVKLARSMRLVGDQEKACNALDILPQQYPNASGVTRNLAALERTRAGCGA